MSGTSSTQPGPTEAPLTPEQRKAYAEIGAALVAGDRAGPSMKEWRRRNPKKVHTGTVSRKRIAR